MSNEGGQEEKGERKGKKRDAILRMLNLRFERKSRGGRGIEKACALVLTGAFKFSLKNLFSFLRLRGVVGVCARHFFCPASFLF